MRTRQVIEMLKIQLEKEPDEEIIIQWWRREDLRWETDMATDMETWKEVVNVWDNSPMTADQAGLYDIVRDVTKANDLIKKKDKSKGLQLIQGGKLGS